MAFVFSWILRWEAFSSTYVRDRLALRPSAPRAASALPDGAPHLLPGTEVSIQTQTSTVSGAPTAKVHQLSLTYAAGGGDQASATIWDEHIQRALLYAPQRAKVPWSASGAWGGTLTLTILEDQDPDELIAAIKNVFAAAESNKRAADVEALRDREHTDEHFPPLRQALQEVTSSTGEPAFSNIELRIQQDAQGRRSDTVWAVFADDLAEAGRDLGLRLDSEWSKVAKSSPGTAHPIGYAVELTASPEAARTQAQRAVSLLEAQRGCIEAEREDIAAASRAIGQRFDEIIARQTTSQPEHRPF